MYICTVLRFNALKTEIWNKKRDVPLFMCLYIKKPPPQSLRGWFVINNQ